MLSIVAVCIGCGGANSNVQSPKGSGNNESNSTATKRPAVAPTEHTKDSIELIQKRVADKEAILIDVREQDEWDLGHLQEAVFIPLSELKAGGSDKSYATNLAKKLPKDKIIYCHCASGGRVMPASAILHKMGYDVRPLKAGYDDLLDAGFKDAE
jgi:rhodanese-related sulfurtransferase